jgi:hypothetical protein
LNSEVEKQLKYEGCFTAKRKIAVLPMKYNLSVNNFFSNFSTGI